MIKNHCSYQLLQSTDIPGLDFSPRFKVNAQSAPSAARQSLRSIRINDVVVLLVTQICFQLLKVRIVLQP